MPNQTQTMSSLADYRASGVLLHVTSSPSPYGTGYMGPAAFAWVDRKRERKHTVDGCRDLVVKGQITAPIGFNEEGFSWFSLKGEAAFPLMHPTILSRSTNPQLLRPRA
jgi:hypothetical protein